ncbi:MAG: 23S rRNA (uracil(1939)-C(5))-methyltransferase RlmD [Bacilli bacterium]|nr:23S rRNA (uracil(1939)-C(5))-methyltransferase RlmD [Bacilli bacterium]
MENILNLNQSILLTIKRIGINGEGIGYFKRQAVFVKGALPGEVVEVKITAIEEKYAIGEVTKMKEKSPERVDPQCPYYGKCGGCHLQHLSYEGQCRIKKDMVYEAFERYFEGNLDKIKFYDTLGMDHPWHYRNKSSLPTRHSGTNVVVGMYQESSNHLIFIDQCLVENELIYQTRKDILTILDQESISVYNPKTKIGSLRNIVIRAFEDTKEVQVTFVLTREDVKLIQVLKKLKVTSANYSINADPKTVDIFGPQVIHVAGSKTIKGNLSELSFAISPQAFFQLNSLQTLVLYDEILKACRLNGTEKVLDCYCGIGSIGMSLASHVAEVRGIDTNKEGIADANQFAQLNGIENAKFYHGNILPHLHQFEQEDFIPDVLVVDPPRKGMDLNLIHYIQEKKIKRIVYVSCNPATLAKNLNHLQKEYSVKFVKPIDMFPQTANVEAVCLIERR